MLPESNNGVRNTYKTYYELSVGQLAAEAGGGEGRKEGVVPLERSRHQRQEFTDLWTTLYTVSTYFCKMLLFILTHEE
jgi:hypothetical protein